MATLVVGAAGLGWVVLAGVVCARSWAETTIASERASMPAVT
jgi:hypothetical protein